MHVQHRKTNSESDARIRRRGNTASILGDAHARSAVTAQGQNAHACTRMHSHAARTPVARRECFSAQQSSEHDPQRRATIACAMRPARRSRRSWHRRTSQRRAAAKDAAQDRKGCLCKGAQKIGTQMRGREAWARAIADASIGGPQPEWQAMAWHREACARVAGSSVRCQQAFAMRSSVFANQAVRGLYRTVLRVSNGSARIKRFTRNKTSLGGWPEGMVTLSCDRGLAG